MTPPPEAPLNAAQVRYFWAKVEKTDECWLWRASGDRKGYGLFGAWVAGKCRTRRAHRLAYEMLVGPIPEGMVIDHLCRIPSCVNPLHLEVVTPRTNTIRGIGPTAVNVRKDACTRGHPHPLPRAGAIRECWPCHVMTGRARRARIRAEQHAHAQVLFEKIAEQLRGLRRSNG